MCEKSVKIGHFSHVFHMVFHIHTPSSVKMSTLLGVAGYSIKARIFIIITKKKSWKNDLTLMWNALILLLL